jgi:hypothetical protein
VQIVHQETTLLLMLLLPLVAAEVDLDKVETALLVVQVVVVQVVVTALLEIPQALAHLKEPMAEMLMDIDQVQAVAVAERQVQMALLQLR